MAESVSQSEAAQEQCSLAKSLAPEDVRVGDYVTLLHEIREWPSFFWFYESTFDAREELLRIQLLPEDGGVPLKVKSVCLPFVLVKHPKGKKFTLDIRRSRLARLNADYARIAWKAHRKKRKSKASDSESQNEKPK